MKSTVSAAILAIASTSSAYYIPANHATSSQPVTPAGYFTNDVSVDTAGQKCFNLKSSIDWYYTMSGPWGTATGKGPSSGNLCVSEDDSAGGAMFIGPNPNPGPGSTKFECYFPTSGEANCDVSLVDGYSLSMTCHAGGQPTTIGGPVNLYNKGHPCGHPSGPNCLNPIGGSAGSQSAIGAFFQPAVVNGNNYCIWHNCGQDYSFDVTADLTCTISGGK